MRFEITTDASFQRTMIAGAEGYEQAEKMLEEFLSRKDKTMLLSLSGARTFIITDADTGEDLKIAEIDEDLNVVDNSLHRIAEKEVLRQPGLALRSLDEEYEEWREETGLDDSAVGGYGVPGTADIYDAARRIKAREAFGKVATITANFTEGDLNSYAGFTVEGPDEEEITFFHEGLTEDFRDAQRWAETGGMDLALTDSVYRLAAEDGIAIRFSKTWDPEFYVPEPAPDMGM